jgi:hypothetical protein
MKLKRDKAMTANNAVSLALKQIMASENLLNATVE